LAGALRRLAEALAKDRHKVAAQFRNLAGRFPQYSEFNQVMVFMQRPDATFVMGRGKWLKEHGRKVRPGTRAIAILAPKQKTYDPTAIVNQFVATKVFDVSDTEGEPFVMPKSTIVRGKANVVNQRLAELERWVRESGLQLLYRPFELNSLADGVTDGSKIWIRPDLSPAERLAVLAHEIAHVKLHFHWTQRGKKAFVDEARQVSSREGREVEAELTSFLLLEFSGVDSAEGTAAYLQSWKASAAMIHGCLERCLLVATGVLRQCRQNRYTKLVKERSFNVQREATKAIV